MVFGKDEFFKDLYERTLVDDDVNRYYDTLTAHFIERDIRTILHNLKFRVSDKVRREDIDDVVQETHKYLFKQLPKYIKEYQDEPEKNRVAYLWKVVKGREKEYWRRYYKSRKKNLKDKSADESEKNAKTDSENGSNRPVFVSLTTEDGIMDKKDSRMTPEEYITEADTIAEITHGICCSLRHIFNMRTKPEYILAYLFNRFVSFFSDSERSSGSPSEVAARFDGMTLGEMAENLKSIIRTVVRYEIPDEVFEALDNKLSEKTDGIKNAEKIFTLDEGTVTKVSSRIRGKLNEQKHLIIQESDTNTHDDLHKGGKRK